MKTAAVAATIASRATLRDSFAAGGGSSLTRRFGDTVDVRNRGALRVMRLVGIQAPGRDTPAVVRLWHGDNCRELSVHDARSLAAQLLEAAACAEQQNNG